MQRFLLKFILGVDLETITKIQTLKEESLNLNIRRLEIENKTLSRQLQEEIHDLKIKHCQTLLTLADEAAQATELIYDATKLATLQPDQELARWVSQGYDATISLTHHLVEESKKLLHEFN